MRQVTIPIDGYSKKNPPLSSQAAIDRMDEIDSVLILLDQESKDSRLSLFETRTEFRQYIDERTKALATLKIERLFLRKWLEREPERNSPRSEDPRPKEEDRVRTQGREQELAATVETLSRTVLLQLDYSPRYSEQNPPNSEAEVIERSELLGTIRHRVSETLSEMRKAADKLDANRRGPYIKVRNRVLPQIVALDKELQYLKHCRRKTSFWPGGMPHHDAIKFLERLVSQRNGELELNEGEREQLSKIQTWLREG